MCRNAELESNINIFNTISCDTNNGSLNIEYWFKVLNSQEERENILNRGVFKANEFISNNYSDFININNLNDKHCDISFNSDICDNIVNFKKK